MRSLLSVDDIVRDVREYLIEQNEWNNTIMVFLSDHGYTLGGFRVDSHKMQVYDHVTRVPFLLHMPRMMRSGERTQQPLELGIPVSMVDVAPTLLLLRCHFRRSLLHLRAHPCMRADPLTLPRALPPTRSSTSLMTWSILPSSFAPMARAHASPAKTEISTSS